MGEPQEKLKPVLSTLYAATLLLFIVEAIAGCILAVSYSPGVATAHAQVAAMHAGPERIVQALHYWASSVLIAASGLLVMAMLWSESYRDRLRVPFTAAVIFFLAALAFQISGNLLPFDRHGAQTASIEAGIAARAPVVGSSFRSLLLGGQGVSGATLRFWYLMHWLLALGIGAGLAGVYRFRRETFGGINKWAAAGLALLPLAVSLFAASPFGSPATQADMSAFDDRPSWYTWPLHGALALMDRVHSGWGWIGAMLIPGIFVLGALLLPWAAPKLQQRFVRGALILCICFFGGAAVFFGGAFSPLTGSRDPVAAGTKFKGTVVPPDAKLAALGRTAFGNLGCSDCHGKDLAGDSGPSLKNESQRHPDREFYEVYVKNPKSVDPSSTMPPFPDLSKDQLDQLADFLRQPR
ncbi:MAG TPA: cytochrome b N-terminal domain-containing protein [Fimbriimonas sp.]|nr:cytochrome b N-terminal domain-containing protein [Fimbriimonas sp.]